MKDVLEIEVPSTLDSITLGQYQKWVELVENLGEDAEEQVLNDALIRIFCNVNRTDLHKIEVLEYDKMLEVLRDAFTNKCDTLVERFTLNGVEYGFEPNIEKMSTAVYIDTEGSLDWENFHIAMDALYRPIAFNRKANGVDQYAVMPYEPCLKKAELMKQAPLDAAMSVRVFFCSLSKDLLKTSLNYLEEVVKVSKDSTLQKQYSQLSTDGIIQFIHSQEELTRSLMKLNLNPYLEH
tara:strand:+ start:600 stop:1310 length:711 start_codon:yes stop_codon:yes gene_type:complete